MIGVSVHILYIEGAEFGRSVNPIQTMGGQADYARHNTARPPGFKMLSTSLSRYLIVYKVSFVLFVFVDSLNITIALA